MINVKDLIYRYWPTLGLALTLVVLVALLPSNAPPTSTQVRAGAPTETTPGRPSSTGGGPAPSGTVAPGSATAPAGVLTAGGPVSPGGAQVPGSVAPGAVPGAPSDGGAGTGVAPGGAAAGVVPGATFPPDSGGGIRPKYDPPPGPLSCREVDGKQDMVGVGAVSCLPLFTEDNGGATYPGVTADKIILANYRATEDPAVQAALVAAGVSDSRQQLEIVNRTLTHYYNTHVETYGREMVFVDVDASAGVENEEAQRADGIRIAEEVGAFACLGCPRYAAEEVIARGLPVIGTFETTEYFIDRVRGYYFGANPTLEEHSIHLAENWGKRLLGRKARFAGDPLIQASDRRLGVMWIDGAYGRVDEGAKLANDFFVRELAKYNTAPTVNVFFNFDFGRAGEQSANMIAKMVNAGVTTVTFVGDPLYPIFITKEATRQNYFPEWLISGSALTDITFFGRTYDQAQWAHAFGQSALWVFWRDNRTSDGYREYHHVCLEFNAPENCDDRDEGVNINTVRANIALAAVGIHGAGPNLNAQTFEQGMYLYPKVGGWPSVPLLFFTREKPWALQDRTEIFWDPTGYGPDEINKEAPGIMLKANGGKRYLPGQWPSTEFENDKSKAVFVSDEPIGAPYTVPRHEGDGHRHPGDQRCRSCRS